MTEKPSTGIEEISLNASLTESGVKASVRSRAFAALDRLVGSLADTATSYFDGKRRLIDERSSYKIEIEKAEHVAALKKLSGNKTLGDRILKSISTDGIIRMENRLDIARKATILITDGTINEQTINPQNTDDSEINPDWMNQFYDYSGSASTEDLKNLWARVLAGEIINPGSFSKTTLRFINEIEKVSAEKFQYICHNFLLGGIFSKPKKLAGEPFLSFLFLEEIGLVSGVNANLSYTPDDSGGHIGIYGEKYILIARKVSNVDLSIPVIKLTPTGRELVNIVGHPEAHVEKSLLIDAAKKWKPHVDNVRIGVKKRAGAFFVIENGTSEPVDL